MGQRMVEAGSYSEHLESRSLSDPSNDLLLSRQIRRLRVTCRLSVQPMLRSSSHELLLDRRRSLPALKVPYRNSRRRLLPALQARHQIVLACFLATFTAYVERVGFSIAYTAMAKEAKVCVSCSAIAWLKIRAMALLP